MKFVMKDLKRLHASMRDLKAPNGLAIELQKFRYAIGALEFECIFSTAERPYVLSMTSRGSVERPESVFFMFSVSANYEIETTFDSRVYADLLSTIKASAGTDRATLKPASFLAGMDATVPRRAAVAQIPTTSEIIASRPDITDERDKPYFSHWALPRRKANGTSGGVSEKNQQKTLLLLGSAALEHSKAHHLSSCWSPAATKIDWRSI